MISTRFLAWALALTSTCVHAQAGDWTLTADAMVPPSTSNSSLRLLRGANGSTLVAGNEMFGTLAAGWTTSSSLASPNVRVIEAADPSIVAVSGGLFPAPNGGGFTVFGQPSESGLLPTVVRLSANGETLWSRELRWAASVEAEFSLSPDGATLAVHLLDGAVVYALDAATGNVHWTSYRDGEYGTDGRNAIAQIVAMNDRSVWIQRGAYSGLMHLSGSQRRIFPGPIEAANNPEGNSCGLIRLSDGWLQISTSMSALLIAKHNLEGTLLATTVAALPPTGSFKQFCAAFRVGDQLAVLASDLFSVDPSTGAILWRRAIPELPSIFDIEAFGGSWIAAGQFAERARVVRIQGGAALAVLAPPHGTEAMFSRAVDLALGPDGIIVSALVARSIDGEIIESPVLSRYSPDLELTLDPQPVQRLIARRGAQIGSVMSADLASQYFAWADWSAGTNTLVVERRNAQTGAITWTQRLELGPSHLGQRALAAAPTLLLGVTRLFISANARPDDYESADAVSVLSLDTVTGALAGRREWGPSATSVGGVWAPSLGVDLSDQPYLLLSESGQRRLLALSSDLQSTRWEQSTSAFFVAVSGDALVLGGSDLRALELNSGQQRWLAAISTSAILSLPDNRLAVATIRQSEPRATRVVVLDQVTGSTIWSNEISTLEDERVRVTALVQGSDTGIYIAGYRVPRSDPFLRNEAPFVAKFGAATGQFGWLYSPPLGSDTLRVSSMIAGADGEIWARTARTEYANTIAAPWENNRGELLRLRGADGSTAGRQLLTTATAPLAMLSATIATFSARNENTWWLRDTLRPSLESRKIRWRAMPAPQFRPIQVIATAAPAAVSVNQNAEFSVAVTLSNAAANPVGGTLSITLPHWVSLRQPTELSLPVTLAAGEQRQFNYVLFAHGPLNCFDPSVVSQGSFTATLVPGIRETLTEPELPSAMININGRSDRLFANSLEPNSPTGC